MEEANDAIFAKLRQIADNNRFVHAQQPEIQELRTQIDVIKKTLREKKRAIAGEPIPISYS